MKKRSKATSKPAKTRARKALKPKGRSAPKILSRDDAAPAPETEVARAIRERNEALEQRAATSEVLKVISRSPGDLQPVFATMLAEAVRICEGNFGNIYRWDGEALNLVATHNTPPAYAEFRKRTPFRADQKNPIGRMISTKTVVQVADLLADQAYVEHDPGAEAAFQLGGLRTFLAVPMLKLNELVGAFVVSRVEVRPFTDKQIELISTFAAQAVIAIENARLLTELRQRTIDLSQRTTDLTEALEQQTATSEVLQTISSSPGDLQRVFAAMLEKAVRLCGAKFGTLYLHEGGGLRLVAGHDVPEFIEARGSGPIQPAPDGGLELVRRTKRTVQIPDLAATQSYAERHPRMVEAVEIGGIRTVVGVPMLKDDDLLGVIAVHRREVHPFTDKQIALVENFAAQAVIAIENARLLNELRESLQEQTATAEVLQVVSSSPGDLQPVFAIMLEKAVRMCDATFGNIYRSDGNAMHLVAAYNTPPAFVDALRSSPLHHAGITGRITTTKTTIHVADLTTDQAYAERYPQTVAAVELGGVRSLLVVPMLKEDELIGAFALSRQVVRPFTGKQIELVQNFAAQAVIAIENARLLNELRQRTADLTESLEQQTATSEVLQVISSSPGDLEPVFATMLEKAVGICDADFGNIYRWDGEVVSLLASHNTPLAFAEARSRSPLRAGLETPLARMIANKAVIHLADALVDPSYAQRRDPAAAAAVELGGVRTALLVPMLRENELIGSFTVYRQKPRPFTDKQIALVTNFAAQAVIAIENARLLTELRESLEEQKATSDVLRVISSSPGDLQPVFDAMLTKAARICDASFGNIFRLDDDGLHLVGTHNTPAALTEARRRAPVRPDPEGPFGRMLASKAVAHITDLAAEEVYSQRRHPSAVAAVELGGVRTVLLVPIVKESELIGVFSLYRQEVRPFTDKQIALVRNFASQAVIAIENARLLGELHQRTEQVGAQANELAQLNQQLELRVADQVGEIERMGRLRRFLPPQVADLIVASGTEKQLESHRREITALFCDLRGFTGFSESADPEDVMTLLREYHAAIGEIIVKYSGTLERYAGDGVMVIFNDPVPVPQPALQAVRAALDMRAAIAALTHKWSRLGHDLGFGVGIAHGHATLGTIGFEGRFDYSAIGTVSNVASRLCDEAKPGQILISPRVLMAVEDAVKVEPVGEFELKGIRRPIAAYNVIAAAPQSA